MTTPTQRSLELRGTPIFPAVPQIDSQIDSHRYDGARREILAKHNKRFRGITGIEDTTNYQEGQSLAHSNTPRAFSYEQRARELGMTEFHILSPEEVVQYWQLPLPEMDTTYAGTNSVALYPNHSQNSDNEKIRQQSLNIVLNLLGIQRIEGPFRVSGLDPHPDPENNTYRFKFSETDNVTAEEAPYLEQNGWIRYDNGKLVTCNQDDEGAVRIWVPESQSGLWGFYRFGSVGLDAGFGGFFCPSESGRVQIFYDPQGRAKILEDRLAELNIQREQQIVEINAKYKEDCEQLKRGNF